MAKLDPYKITEIDLKRIKQKLIVEPYKMVYGDSDLDQIANILDKALDYLKNDRLQDVNVELEDL